ncbi:MAG: response regulator [Anaerolineae bacterium]
MIKTRILVVEDESIVALDIQSQLTDLGYNVLSVVTSGEKAIRKAAEIKPDLVLMDIQLKGKIDGVEAAEQIRTRHNIPVIYLTAHVDKVTFQRAKVTEPFAYLLKPFDERELHTAIEIALYRQQVEERLQQRNQELQAAYEQLQRTQEELVKVERLAAMGQIAVTVSHEINNPLTVVLGNIERLLAAASTFSTENRERLRQIEAGTIRIRDVVRKLGDSIEDRPVLYLSQTMMIDIHGGEEQQT